MKNILLIFALLMAEATFGQSASPKSAPERNSVAKLANGIAVQYVSPTGNDSNDGLSWETAKRTVVAALEALPGGNSTTAGHGTVDLMDGVSWTPIANQGLWLMGRERS